MKALPLLTGPLMRAGERIGRGAAAIGWRIARWTLQKGTPSARIGRLATIPAAGWAAERILAHQRLSAALIAVFLIVSYREGTALAVGDVDDGQDAEEGQAEADLTELQATAGQWRAGIAEEVIGTARQLANGDHGVHLDRVHADWAERGLINPDRTLTEFRRMCDQVGVPVRDSLKVAGINRIGIHFADLTDHSPNKPEADQ